MVSAQEKMQWTGTLQAGEEVAQSKSDKKDVKRDQILAHELKVMRRFCHTLSSKQVE